MPWKIWKKKTFKGFFVKIQVFRIISDYYVDDQKIIWNGKGKWKGETFPHRFEFEPNPIIELKNIKINKLALTSKQELHRMVYTNFVKADSFTLLDMIYHSE